MDHDVDRAQQCRFNGLLLGIVGMAFLTIHLLSVLAPAIISDLGISRSAYGVLSLSLFVTAAIVSVRAGNVIDRVSTTAALRGLFGIAGFAWVLLAVAPSFWALVLASGFGGVGMAVGVPLTSRLVSMRVRPNRRGTSLGVAHAGSQLGFFLAGASLPALAAFSSWRLALVGPIVLAVLATFWAARVPEGSPPTGRAGQLARSARLSEEEAHMVTWLAVYTFLMGAAAIGATAYLTLYAFEVVGFSPTRAGWVAATAGASAIFGKITWGAICERSAIPARSLTALPLLAIGCIALLWGAGNYTWFIWAGTVLYGFSAAAWSAVVMFGVAGRVRAEAAGQASGTVMRAGFFGSAVGPVIAGLLADLDPTYLAAWTALVVLLVTAAIVSFHPGLRSGWA